jgi:hypothetical protein
MGIGRCPITPVLNSPATSHLRSQAQRRLQPGAAVSRESRQALGARDGVRVAGIHQDGAQSVKPVGQPLAPEQHRGRRHGVGREDRVPARGDGPTPAAPGRASPRLLMPQVCSAARKPRGNVGSAGRPGSSCIGRGNVNRKRPDPGTTYISRTLCSHLPTSLWSPSTSKPPDSPPPTTRSSRSAPSSSPSQKVARQARHRREGAPTRVS